MTWLLSTNAQTVLAGEGALEALEFQLQLLGVKRVALLASQRAGRGVAASRVTSALADFEISYRNLEVSTHSPLGEAQEIAAAVATAGADVLLAVGGGSPIDTAKAVALLLAGVPLELDLGPGANAVPIATVPTTLAGAEFTPVGALTKDNHKHLFANRSIAATVTVYDPAAIEDVPRDVLASTGMNGLAHCLEASYSLVSNPVAAALGIAGARSLATALRELAADSRSAALYERLQAGAVLGGLAIAAGGAGIHHAVCHVLGGSFGVAHGAGNAAFLPYALEYNEKHTLAVQSELARAIADDGAARDLKLSERVAALQAELGVASDLESLGIRSEDLERIATETLQDPTSHLNPRSAAGAADLMPMLERAHSGALAVEAS